MWLVIRILELCEAGERILVTRFFYFLIAPENIQFALKVKANTPADK